MPCKVCGYDRVVAHHDDYNKSLIVRWLCYIMGYGIEIIGHLMENSRGGGIKKVLSILPYYSI